MTSNLWPDFNQTLPNCRANYSYFTTSDYLRNAYHLTAILTIPLSLFTLFCILKITPKRMRNMKIPLLISHLFSTNMDLIFTVYSAPMAFFPSASGSTFGVLTAVGVPFKWQAYWGQVSLMMVGVCFVMLYENRHSQLSSNNFKIKSNKVRIVYFSINFFLSFLIMLPFYLEDSDQLELRKIVLKRIPCPTIEFFETKAYVLLKGGEILPFYSITGGLSLVIFQTLFFLIHTMIHLYSATNQYISTTTKNLQKKYLTNVSIQISIPLVVIVFPVSYSLFADQNDYYNQAINNNALIALANHGLCHTTCTLIIYKPYREFVKEIFLKRRDTENDTMVTVAAARSRASKMGSVSLS